MVLNKIPALVQDEGGNARGATCFCCPYGQPLLGLTDPAVLLTAMCSCEENLPSFFKEESCRGGLWRRVCLLAPSADSLEDQTTVVPGLVVIFIISRPPDMSSILKQAWMFICQALFITLVSRQAALPCSCLCQLIAAFIFRCIRMPFNPVKFNLVHSAEIQQALP